MIREQDDKHDDAKGRKDHSGGKEEREPPAVEAQVHIEHHDQHALEDCQRNQYRDLDPQRDPEVDKVARPDFDSCQNKENHKDVYILPYARRIMPSVRRCQFSMPVCMIGHYMHPFSQ